MLQLGSGLGTLLVIVRLDPCTVHAYEMMDALQLYQGNGIRIIRVTTAIGVPIA